MITLYLHSQREGPETRRWCYRIAAHTVLTDVSLSCLAAFQVNDSPQPDSIPLPIEELDAPRFVYQGPGWIGNRWREVTCHAGPAGYRVLVEDIGAFGVAADGRWAALLEANPAAPPSAIVEAALGPALILALAIRGAWCLHASAVSCGGRLLAFTGESGNGKSTLAAYLDTQGASGFRRIADDVTPLALGPGGLNALPHYPQLKLPPEKQPSRLAPERLPLTALYRLTPLPREADLPDGGLLQPLERREAALTLVRHTIAARLFDRELLARHMDFCATAAALLPVRQILYPHRRDALPHVRDALFDDLATLP